jgi:hypothetical protein
VSNAVPKIDFAVEGLMGIVELDVVSDERFITARTAWQRAAVRQNRVDDVTSEVVRLRNASFQHCRF